MPSESTLNLEDILNKKLELERRPFDGMLHPSTDLTAPLRHVQLRMSDAPEARKAPLGNAMRAATGTMVHDWIDQALKGKLAMTEVDLTPWLPDGWSGRADALIWNEKERAFELHDWKTKEGHKISWVDKMGPSDSHVLQVSAYWMAAACSGIPLVRGAWIHYIPLSEENGEGGVRSIAIEVDQSVWQQMIDIFETVLRAPKYADPPERVQKVIFNKKTGQKNVVLDRPWYAKYCYWDAPYCHCSELEGQTKVGELVDDVFVPREGFEDYEYHD